MSDPQIRGAYYVAARDFHSTRRMQVVKPVLLADIGEGMELLISRDEWWSGGPWAKLSS